MDKKILQEATARYRRWIAQHHDEFAAEAGRRAERKAFYQAWTEARFFSMDDDGFLEFMSKLWALEMWGSKPHIVNYIIERNTLSKIREELAELVWSARPIAERWDRFRKNIRDMGPAQISEVLCHTHPAEFVLWNKRVRNAFITLGVEKTPRHDYQLTGARYAELCGIGRQIGESLAAAGMEEVDLLLVDYFLWQELGGKDAHPFAKGPQNAGVEEPAEPSGDEKAEFIHNDVRDKLREIGEWLGFQGNIETKVADGSKVDAVWEATIGNMGRVIYVFEVQTGGSIDSLIVNLLKSRNNPAVQGVVAVSDAAQIEKIKKYAAGVPGLGEKLKYWNYEDVLRTHELLSTVYESINALGLVPDGF
jgi:hypothetical protein